MREILHCADRRPDRQCALVRQAETSVERTNKRWVLKGRSRFERILELAHSDNSAHRQLATQEIKAISFTFRKASRTGRSIRLVTCAQTRARTFVVPVSVDVGHPSDDEREVTVIKKALQGNVIIDHSSIMRGRRRQLYIRVPSLQWTWMSRKRCCGGG